MFSFSSLTPSEPKGTLTFATDPRRQPFGTYEDVNGVRWHCGGVVGGCILATPLATLDPLWSSTAPIGGGLHQATWDPYWVKVVDGR